TPPGYPLLAAGPVYVYARPSSGPAILVPVAVDATERQMWAAVAATGWDPTRTAAVMHLRRTVDGGTGTVTAAGGALGRDRWQVDAPRGGFLRVSGRYDRGWSARLDNRRVEVLRADGVFRGVVVPPGRHTVVFTYTNRAERRGRLLASVGLLL